MIQLNPDHLAAVRRHGESDYPHECCGLLIGALRNGGSKSVDEVYPISNAREASARRNRFLISPEELLRGERHARGRQLEVIGFYHSHPDCPAVPSQFDLDNAWPVYSYLIVSVRQGRAEELLSWELLADRSRFEAEVIQKGP